MALDPSIPLQIRPPQFPGPLEQAQQVYGLMGLLQRQKLIEAQLREQELTAPLTRAKMRAEIDAIPELAAQRKAAAVKSKMDALRAQQQQQAQGRLAALLTPQGYAAEYGGEPPMGVFGNEAAALEAAKQAQASGQPFRYGVPNPSTIQSLAIQADPQHAIQALLKGQNQPPQRPTVVGPGAHMFQPGQTTPSFSAPFAPREVAPVVRPVPNPAGGMDYQDMRNPGVPLAAAPVPASVSRDPKAQAAYQAGLREVQRDDAQMATVSQLETALKRWSELNSQVVTGRVAGWRPQLMQPMLQEMDQLQSYLAVNNFKPGQGQISNYERQLIKGAGPTVFNDKETNDRIIQVQLGAVQNAKDRANFKEWYLENKGNMLGADRAWNEYIEKNPRYLKADKGNIVPNPKRAEWPQYFGVGGTPRQSAPAPTPVGIPASSILDQADAILNRGR